MLILKSSICYRKGLKSSMYTFNSRVRYSEMNHQRKTLNPSSIINYFQDCSTFQSNDMVPEQSSFLEKNRVWLLNSWQLDVRRFAHLGDYITIGTWPYNFKGFYGYRNFIMTNEKEEVLSVANSIWVYIDTKTGHPTRIPDHTGYETELPYPMDYANRKIEIPLDLVTYPSFFIIKSNIDSYNHVNNGQYIKMAEEFLPENLFVSGMRVEYRMQAMLGDIIVPKVNLNDEYLTVVLSSKENLPYAIIEFQIIQQGKQPI